ncbi:hypothetical protein, partial [Neisseria meningitidis]|uniref:hypothetical protein n=1 Tax=Neisseria meningitidis TaxID=487 RepID=UPI001C58AD52
LMFSHTGGGGGVAATQKYATIMRERKQPEAKTYGPSSIKEKKKGREIKYHSPKPALINTGRRPRQERRRSAVDAPLAKKKIS